LIQFIHKTLLINNKMLPLNQIIISQNLSYCSCPGKTCDLERNARTQISLFQGKNELSDLTITFN